jgi:hypothetical protein
MKIDGKIGKNTKKKRKEGREDLFMTRYVEMCIVSMGNTKKKRKEGREDLFMTRYVEMYIVSMGNECYPILID